jgi:hypothetical protein
MSSADNADCGRDGEIEGSRSGDVYELGGSGARVGKSCEEDDRVKERIEVVVRILGVQLRLAAMRCDCGYGWSFAGKMRCSASRQGVIICFVKRFPDHCSLL